MSQLNSYVATEAMKQALEALEELVDLKRQKNRLQELHEMGHGTDYTDYHRRKPLAWPAAESAITALRSAIEQAESAGPVAIIRTWHKNGDQHAEFLYWEDHLGRLPDGKHKLYAHPPQRKPLTDDQAKKLSHTGPVHSENGVVTRTPFAYRDELQSATLRGIRLAERAHGIE